MTHRTLEYNGVEKSYADWRIINARRENDSQGADRYGFNIVKQDAATDLQFPFGAEITIRRQRIKATNGTFSGGNIWYRGYALIAPREFSPAMEQLEYKFTGPVEFFLGRLTYQQYWSSYGAYVSQLNLMQSNLGVRQNTQLQLIDIVQFAIDRTTAEYGAAKIAFGDGWPVVDAPINQVSDITCLQAAQNCLRWAPDAVTWVDYTAAPPKIHIRRRSELTPAELSVFQGEGYESLKITRRDDRVVPCVHLKYRQTAEVDDQSIVQIFDDKFPADGNSLAFDAFINTYDFLGVSMTTARARIVTESYAAAFSATPAIQNAWWQRMLPSQLGGTKIHNLVIAEASSNLVNEDLVNRLIDGQVAEWMGFTTEKITIKAFAFYERLDDDDNVVFSNQSDTLDGQGVEISVQITVTDGTTGNYSSSQIQADAEELPYGLAEQMFEALSAAGYEGSFTLVQQEIDHDFGIGNTLRLNGGRLEWETLGGLIQSVTYDEDAGRTTFNFGPAPFLLTGDLLDLYRVSHTRNYRNNPAMRTDNTASNSQVELGSATADTVADHAQMAPLYQSWRSGTVAVTHDAQNSTLKIVDTSGGGKSVTIDLRVLPAGKALALREYPICIDSVPLHFWAIGTEPA